MSDGAERDGQQRLGDVRRLREEFDRAFAAPPPAAAAAGVEVLAVRVGGERYALALAEVAGLQPARVVVPSVSSAPHLMGIAGFRGKLAAVYDLGGLLGHARAAELRWLVLSPPPVVVALAFEGFEGHQRCGLDELVERSDEGSPARHGVRGAVRTRDGFRPLIHLPTLLAEIAKGQT
jgi:chemotaxis signal transduction protein